MKLHYTKIQNGSKPWIIFMHGLLGSSRNWLKIIAEFENDFNIINVDQRGHGKSEAPDTGYAPMDFAEDVHEIIHDLNIQKAIVVGHSMGARNALILAHHYYNHVSHLIMEDMGPESTYQNAGSLIERLKKIPVPFKDKKSAKEFLLNEFDDPMLGQFLYTRLREDSDGATWDFKMKMVEEIINSGRAKDLWEEVRELKMPTLVVRGGKSTELRAEELEKMISINPNVKGVTIKDAGHWVHFEKPKEFISAVKDFLVRPPKW
ncbi:MAG: alpha/beta hydrolase [Oligoflexia bacterium]|nr:alpha/beta hydrolase [Oligoflexia bacterium]